MAVGNSAGVVLRSRLKPTNLLTITEGFDAREAGSAAAEAAEILEQAAYSGEGDISATVSGLPLVCGSVLVGKDRYRVMYRMVGQLMVAVVTDASANALACLDLLGRCVRVVTLDFRSPELSIDKFGKRYQEVYMALSLLLASGGTVTAGRALSDGRQALDAIINSSRAKRDTAGGVGAAADPSKGETLPGTEGTQTGSYRSRRRTLASQAAQLPMQLGFPTDDVMRPLRPLPAFEDALAATDPSAAPRNVPVWALHQFKVDDEFKPAAAPSATAAAGGDLGGMLDELSDMLGPPVAGKDKDKAQAHKKGEDPFAFVESDLLGDKKPSKAPAGPPPPPVPEAPLLRLMETWRGEVRGRALVRATQRGEVMCTPSLNTSSLPVVGFALAYTGPQPMSPATEAALRSTRVMQPMVRPGWPPGYVVCEGGSETGGEGDLEGFTLDVSATRGLLTPVIARYKVPCGPSSQPGWQAPVRMVLGASFTEAPGGQTAVLLGIQLQLDSALPTHSIAGVDVKLHIPALYELPNRVRPAGAVMDGARRLLSWSVPGDAPAAGQPPPPQPPNPANASTVELRAGAVAFSAAFLVSGSVMAAKGVLRTVLAEVEMRGLPGTTLSRVMLRQHGFTGANTKASQAVCGWKVVMTGKMI